MITALAAIGIAAALVAPMGRLVRRIRHQRALGKAAKAADERMLRNVRKGKS